MGAGKHLRNNAFRSMAGAIALGLLATGAAAQTPEWRHSSSGGDASAYIDTASIVRDGDKVKFWREIRYAAARSDPEGTSYDRITALYHGDCKDMTLRVVSLRVGLREKVLAEAEVDGEIEPVAPGTAGAQDLRAACFSEWPA